MYNDLKKFDHLSPEEMKIDFVRKSELLALCGYEVSAYTFYSNYLFSGLDNLSEDFKIVLTNYDAPKGEKVHKLTVDEIEQFNSYNNVALSPCLYWKNWKSKSLVNYVCAFVLDIDKVRPRDLGEFINFFEEGKIPTPTFIANSGSGVHFYYILNEPFPINPKINPSNNDLADLIYNGLYDIVHRMGWGDAQRHWIGQEYRVVNSKTKLGQTSSVFKIGDIYTIEDLLTICQIELTENKNIDRQFNIPSEKMIQWAKCISEDLNKELPDLANAKEVYGFIKENKVEYKKNRNLRKSEALKDTSKHLQKVRLPRLKIDKENQTFYTSTYETVKEVAVIGNRYNSCLALAVIANKDNISEEVFFNDLEELIKHWNVKFSKEKFNQKNVEAIKRFYRNQYDANAKTLEKWLGFKFRRIASMKAMIASKNRNYEPFVLEVHLEEKRLLRDHRCKKRGVKWDDNSGRKKASLETSYVAQKLKRYLLKHPDVTRGEIKEATGISYPTIQKWYDIVKESIESENGTSILRNQDNFETVKKIYGRPKNSTKDVTSSPAAITIKEYLLKNPTSSKYAVIKNTGLTKPTVYKWYDQVKELIENEKDDKQMTIYDYIEE